MRMKMMNDKQMHMWVPGEILDKILSGEPLEIVLEAPCRVPVVARISVKKPGESLNGDKNE